MPTLGKMIRIRLDVDEKLRDAADRAGVSSEDLASRYIEEGLRRETHPQIVFAPGRATILGSRLSVAQAIITIGQNQNSIEETSQYLEVPENKLLAAVDYYQEFQHEIDEEIEEVKDII